MSFDPTLFPGGPAFLTRAGVVLQAQDESWKYKDASKNFPVPTNLRGPSGQRVDSVMGVISLKPIATTGNLAALLTALVPQRQVDYGKLIYPATDVTTVIQTKLGGTGNAGQSVTYTKSAVTKYPTLTCAPNKPLFGEIDITTMLASGTTGGTLGNFLTIADSTYTDPSLSVLTHLYDTYTLAYGTAPAAPFNDIAVDDSGIVITPAVKLEPVLVSKYGPVNMRNVGITLEVSFRPVQMTLANFNTLFPRDGVNMGRGAAVNALGGALTVMGSGAGRLALTVPNVTVKPGSAGLEFNAKTGYVDRITMEANPTDNAGAFVELFTLGVQ